MAAERGTSPSSAPPGFEEFFKSHMREALRMAMYAGGTLQEAEDATNRAMTDIFRRWAEIRTPAAYLRRAVMSELLKEKKSGPGVQRARHILLGLITQDAVDDPGLRQWEDQEYVSQLLESLPPAQRAVMTLIVDGYTPAEIALLLGKTQTAVRSNLHAARRNLLRQITEMNRLLDGREAATS